VPGVRQWSHLEVLTHTDVNDYLMGQAVPRFVSATARDAALPAPVEGMVCHVAGIGLLLRTGGAWAELTGGGGGAVDSVNGQTGVVVLDQGDVGLGAVDNTSDLAKPLSTATTSALAGKYATTGGGLSGAVVINNAAAAFGLSVNNTHASGVGFKLELVSGTGFAFGFRVNAGTAEAQYRFSSDTSGLLRWSSGTVASETNLYRMTSGGLKTDGVLHVGGVLRPGVYTTALRPTAATAGVGGMVYDSTLSKPVWSDGTAWRDATGTVV
jgi:hypothetical protein